MIPSRINIKIQFIIITLIYIFWIGFYISVAADSKPGLIDDGLHIYLGNLFEQAGPFQSILEAAKATSEFHRRYYGNQYELAALYKYFFGYNFVFWYLGNIAICFFSAALIYRLIFIFTHSLYSAGFGSLVFLTSSPISESIVAGFGKAEPLMSFFFLASISLGLPQREVLFFRKNIRNIDIVKFISSALLLILTATTKESGILLCGIYAAAIGLAIIASHDRRNVSFLSYAYLISGFACGALALFIKYWTQQSDYIRNYFKLNWDISNLADAFYYYASQNFDILLLLPITPIIVIYYNSARRGSNDEKKIIYWPVLATFYAVALIYMLLLLPFRFHLGYYLYVPSILLSVTVGLSLSSKDFDFPKKTIVILLILLRGYTIPYNYYIALSQKYFDATNFAALSAISSLNVNRVIISNMLDSDQPIQEWNLLGKSLFSCRMPPAYGGQKDFSSSTYMDFIRSLPCQVNNNSFPPISDIINSVESNASKNNIAYEQPNIFPKAGDLLAIRFGDMHISNFYLRAVLPQNFQSNLEFIDNSVLQHVSTISNPFSFPLFSSADRLTYGWKLYRLTSDPSYVISGLYDDLWISEKAFINIKGVTKGASIRVNIFVPSEATPLTLTVSGDTIKSEKFAFTKSGNNDFFVALDSPTLLKISANKVFTPSTEGLSNDTRKLSLRVLNVSLNSTGR